MDVTRGCLACQAGTATKHRYPLVPTEPPSEVWKDLTADHWGPTPNGKYVLVVIDKLSKFPELEIVSSTSAEPNIRALDNIFSIHGYCDTLTTDNGPPFNGNEYHELQKYFTWAGITHKTLESAEDPEANGFVDAFMTHIGKVWHTVIIERKDPIIELNKHMQMIRATPHPSTGKAPAELMYGKRATYQTRLPEINDTKVPDEVIETQDREREAKQRQKYYKDNKPYVKPHQIKVNDTVLLA